MSTHISVVGTIATEPRLIASSSGTQLCTFRLASDERRYDREQHTWVEGNTNWFSVVSFRSLATHASESFAKGDRVIVSGRLRVRNWEKDEKHGTAVEVEADAIGHDLRWGVTRFEKRSTSQFKETSHSEETVSDQWHTSALPHSNHEEEASSDGFTPDVAAA